MTMKVSEAIKYIENYGWSTTKLGLERTRTLLRALGNPEKNLKFIHVAGSNGKGSTSAMLSSILQYSGYKTGLYISPYIQNFEERIQINGMPISGDRLALITERVKEIADRMDDHPSQFELVTAIAIEYYFEEKCDIVVLEVGMGGALDSTNAIDAPEVAVICNIGLEHTEYLGDSIEKIAETKAGIIKEGTDVICYKSDKRAIAVIEKIAKEKNVPLTVADFDNISLIEDSLDGQRFSRLWNGEQCDDFLLPLLGKHQLRNAEVVFSVLEALVKKGWKISLEPIKKGLLNVSWPARFEVLSKDPVFILDGGHNPQCAEALAESISEYLPEEKIIYILGVLRDKDYHDIIDIMMPYAHKYICVTPLSERALPASDLSNSILDKGGEASYADSISDGILMALEESGSFSSSDCNYPIIAFGSLYLAGEIRNRFMEVYKDWIRKEVKARRKALPESERISKSYDIVNKIIKTKEYIESETIMIYKWSFAEVRLDELAIRAKEDGKTVCYPSWGDGDIVPWNPGDSQDAWIEIKGYWHPNKKEGRKVDPSEIDLIICPLVAFDSFNNRLGMGGGYYDRFLKECDHAHKIGVAFSVQKINEVPKEPHDMPLDCIITED